MTGASWEMCGVIFVRSRRALALEPRDLNLNPIPVTMRENKSWTSQRTSWQLSLLICTTGASAHLPHKNLNTITSLTDL